MFALRLGRGAGLRSRSNGVVPVIVFFTHLLLLPAVGVNEVVHALKVAPVTTAPASVSLDSFVFVLFWFSFFFISFF